MKATRVLDRTQRRFPVLGYPLAVIYKFADDIGGYLAALLTYYCFVSLVPAMLLASTVLGILLRSHPQWQETLLHSALAEFPVIGDQLKAPRALSGGPGAVTIGILGSLYGALGAAQAFQYAINTVWQVPRNSRPNPFAARGRSMLLMLTVGIGLAATVVLNTVVNQLGVGQITRLALVLGTIGINMLVFLAAFEIGSAIELHPPKVWVGALLCGVGWYGLQTFGAEYVNRVVRHASAVNGVFALVLGMLAYIYLAAVMVVIALEVDVVRVRRLYPRALLTPFTDAVDLTPGDVKTYTGSAKAARAKGFEQINVTFRRDRAEGGSHAVEPGTYAKSTDVANRLVSRLPGKSAQERDKASSNRD